MPYCDHERYQLHCLYCHQRFEADSAAEALLLVMEHERQCEARR